MNELYKLLVINPLGTQEIIEVQMSGSYYDESRIMYDERVCGPMPQEMIDAVGAIVEIKQDGECVIDEDIKDSIIESKEQEEISKLDRAADIEECKKHALSIDTKSSDPKKAIKYLLYVNGII